MTLLNFITKVAPTLCGVHPAFGRIAELVFLAEKDEPDFAPEKFESTRERAELAVPYQTENIKTREHVLDVIELALCSHRQAKHSEDHAERIEILKAKLMSEEELEMAMRDWWSQ